MQPIENEGRTVAEAVEAALKQSGLRRDQVEVTVIEEGAAGFLGMGAKPARVRLTEKRWGDGPVPATPATPPKPVSAPRPARPPRPAPPPPRPFIPAPTYVAPPKPAPAPAPAPAPTPAVRREEPRRGGARSEGRSEHRAPRERDAARPSFKPATPEEAAEACAKAQQLVVELLQLMKIAAPAATASWDADMERVKVVVESQDASVIVGRDGRVLESLQFLATLMMSRGAAAPIAVQVDALSYWEKREAAIIDQARAAIETVKATGKPVRLEPMDSAMRRLIHRTFAASTEITTGSEGEGTWRKIVVRPEEGVTDTIVAPATPAGRGALGVVRVSGPGARRAAREILGDEALVPRRAATRTARRAGRAVDRVVAVFWEAPETPTGEDLLELTAHGSPEILRELVAAAVDSGARPAEPGEFTRRAFVNGRLDLAQAEGVEALIRARGESARRSALERLEGGLSRAVAAVRAPILDQLALLEARLDHPDEDIAPLTASAADAAFAALRPPLERLLAAFDRGRAEREGLRVCLVGRPNAGKSSLLNALLGTDRAIVAATPGTTRDTLSEPAVLEGLPAVIVDTAGLRDDATDPAEREGVARAERALAACDVAVLVVDAARPEDEADARAHRRALELAAREGRPVVVARSKCDLAGAAAVMGGISVSAKSGTGLAELARAVAAAAAASSQGDEGEALLVGTRDRDAFAAALAELDAARAAVAAHPGVWEDRAAFHLREAHSRLGRVIGEGAPEEVLHAVFSRFCVGK